MYHFGSRTTSKLIIICLHDIKKTLFNYHFAKWKEILSFPCSIWSIIYKLHDRKLFVSLSYQSNLTQNWLRHHVWSHNFQQAPAIERDSPNSAMRSHLPPYGLHPYTNVLILLLDIIGLFIFSCRHWAYGKVSYPFQQMLFTLLDYKISILKGT